MPDEREITERRLLIRPVAAIPVQPDEIGGARLGAVQQLAAGATVGICGSGFNGATVLIENERDGQFYFVFRQDMDEQPTMTPRVI